jgi:hypothetical protein
MPIKGAYLITSGLAGRMERRKMLDIDILVLPGDFQKAVEHFSHHPKAKPDQNYWPFEMSFHYDMGHAGVYVEIHHQINYPERFVLPAQDLFARSTHSSGPMILPCPEDAMLILLCHALVHIAYEFRGTVFEEISLISEQKGFSWERFWELSEGTGIRRFICMILSWYGERLKKGLTVPHLPLYSSIAKPLLTSSLYQFMPTIIRKLIFEIPFAAEPWKLIKKNYRRKAAAAQPL